MFIANDKDYPFCFILCLLVWCI